MKCFKKLNVSVSVRSLGSLSLFFSVCIGCVCT